MINLLMHKRLVIRTGATIIFTLGLLVIIWILSYLFLPTGLVKINFTASLISSSPYTIAAQIFGANMILGAFGLVMMNQWHDARGLAVGYYIHFFRSAVFHGMLRGTNSFAFPYSSQIEIVTGFFKVGIWETLAFCLICSATAAYAAYPTDSPKGLKSFFAFLARPARINRDELLVMIIGGLIMGFSSIMETLNIING
jgi:hypothetical protein